MKIEEYARRYGNDQCKFLQCKTPMQAMVLNNFYKERAATTDIKPDELFWEVYDRQCDYEYWLNDNWDDIIYGHKYY